MTESVQVTSIGESVNTTSGEIARVVDREQVQNLALNGRNYLQLATLIPGAPLLDDNALNIMTGLGINTSVNGSRTNASLLMVDGGFNMDSGSNNSQISNVGIDFIEEVNIKTANFSAEYGRNSGAAINVVTRSGTNAFRGSLFEYHRERGPRRQRLLLEFAVGRQAAIEVQQLRLEPRRADPEEQAVLLCRSGVEADSAFRDADAADAPFQCHAGG